MSQSYDPENAFSEMSASTQFTFTEGHIRLLIWMCDQQAEQLENCFDEALKNDEDPSDVVMNCREGVFDLKCWALRLLDQLEDAQYEDEEVDDDPDLTDDETLVEDFREALVLRSRLHREVKQPEQPRSPLQKLRLWVLSVLVRNLAS